MTRVIDRNGRATVYEYDAASNRISKETSVKGDISMLADIDLEEVQVTEGTTAYTYNALNQLVTEASPEGNIIYTYDANGNLVKQTGSKTADYSYDKENHLTKATIQQGDSIIIEEYTYDYAGNRTSKTVNEKDTTFYVKTPVQSLPWSWQRRTKMGKKRRTIREAKSFSPWKRMEKYGIICMTDMEAQGF